MAICSIFPPGRSPSRLGSSIAGRGGETILTRRTPVLTRSVPVNFQASKVNRDVWGTYQEVRIPVTSPAWKLPGAYSLEFDIAEREEWYSQNTSATTAPSVLPEEHSQFDAQKPKFSVRWQPLDPKWIGALTLRGSYSEGFHAPTLPDLTPAGTEIFLATPGLAFTIQRG